MLLAGVGLEVRSVGRTNVNSTCYPIVDTFRWISSELALEFYVSLKQEETIGVCCAPSSCC